MGSILPVLIKKCKSPLKAKLELELMNIQMICLPNDDPIAPLEEGWWWLGRNGKTVVCFASLKQSSQWLDTVYLARSGVLLSWRGRGLQKRLIGVREKFAKKLGYNWVVTDTTDNLPSANSLISKGYKMFEPSNPWAMKTSIYWRKKL